MPYTIDESRWPTAVLRVVGLATREEEVEIVQRTNALALEGERYALIVDLLESATPTPRFIRLQAQAQREHHDTLAKHCAGVAFVIDSPMLRGALKAVLYLQPLPCHKAVVKTLEEAEAWTSDALQSEVELVAKRGGHLEKQRM